MNNENKCCKDGCNCQNKPTETKPDMAWVSVYDLFKPRFGGQNEQD